MTAQPQPPLGCAQIRVGWPERQPVMLPAVVNHHDRRMEGNHVALELRESLFRGPAPCGKVKPCGCGGMVSGEQRERARWIRAELGARIPHENDPGVRVPRGP